MERFVETLFSQAQGGPRWWVKAKLVEIAGLIIGDPRFTPSGYRASEVRVSEQRHLLGHERVHYVAPRHEDVPSLMAGFLEAWQAHHLVKLRRPLPGALMRDGKPYSRRRSCGTPFVDFVMAGCLSFGFVYIHPFEDGNGRLHRLMLHHVLSSTHFTPPRVVIPISAAILHDRAGYDAALEDFSTRVMPFIEYTIDDADGSLQVTNETALLYRYPDLTAQIEALCGWFESAVRTELVTELNNLRAFDEARAAMRDVVELPDQRENLFLRLCVQNHQAGRGFKLSRAKRAKLFSDLEDAEVAELEAAIREAFQELP
jgi:Fic/DOC family